MHAWCHHTLLARSSAPYSVEIVTVYLRVRSSAVSITNGLNNGRMLQLLLERHIAVNIVPPQVSP